MTDSLQASYSYCRGVARKRARNFYYSFLLLDKPRRDGMCALYAYNRVCDDMSDEPARFGYESPRKAIEEWRAQLRRALAGDYADHPCWPALHDTVRRFGIPGRYLHDMLDGVSSDLERTRMATFGELYEYCYQVASAVGLSVVHVFGFETEEALPLAEKCGIAFQLTNILRDVREDAAMGRVYLPAEDLDRFGVAPEVLREGSATPEFRALMKFESSRAREYYREAAPLVRMVDSGSRGSLWALMRIYKRLLERIEAADFDVLRQPVRVPAWEKCAILLRGIVKGG